MAVAVGTGTVLAISSWDWPCLIYSTKASSKPDAQEATILETRIGLAQCHKIR